MSLPSYVKQSGISLTYETYLIRGTFSVSITSLKMRYKDAIIGYLQLRT